MAPREPIRLALRWEFTPFRTRFGAIRWTWQAYSQSGKLRMESSPKSFDTFTECVEDAKLHGYQTPESR